VQELVDPPAECDHRRTDGLDHRDDASDPVESRRPRRIAGLTGRDLGHHDEEDPSHDHHRDQVPRGDPTARQHRQCGRSAREELGEDASEGEGPMHGLPTREEITHRR